MAITWTTALDTPVNVSATLQDGGSLSADTTYYVRICAANYSGVPTSGGDNILRSEPSTEINFTTTATKKTVDLSWDAVTDATYYNVYISTTSDSYVNKSATRRNSVATNSLTYDGSTSPYFHNDWFVYKNNAVPGNFGEAGMGKLTLSGSLGTITPQDLADEISSGYVYWDGHSFIVAGYVEIEAGTTGSLTFSNMFIMARGGRWLNNSGDFTLTMNSCKYCSGAKVYVNSLANMTLYNTVVSSSFGSWTPYNLMGDDYVSWDSSTVDNGYNTFKVTHPMVYASVNNFTVIGDLNVTGATNVTITNSTASGGLTLYQTKPNRIIRDCRFDKTTPYGIYTHNECIETIYDCSFPNQSSNIRPIVRWNTPGEITLDFSIQLKIIDYAGDPIDNVTVTLTDTDGTKVIDTTTDGDGEITKTDVDATIITPTAGGGTYDSDYDDKGPHTLTVTKSGYETYTSTFTLDEKKEWVIALKTAKQLLLDTSGNPYLDLDAANATDNIMKLQKI